MGNNWKENLTLASKKWVKKDSSYLAYGTAGFRARADELDHILFRMGLLVSIRSRVKNSAVGLMITASHNPEPDNGVKLVDPQGEMLEPNWENIATKLANVNDSALIDELDKILKAHNVNLESESTVFIGRDTRPSSQHLYEAASEGVQVFGGTVHNKGVITTPMLHYFVAEFNAGVPLGDLERSYFENITSSFKNLRASGTSSGRYSPVVSFDGSNGVGAIIMKKFIDYLGDSLTVQIYNDDIVGKGKLNYMCGADHVKTNQKAPDGIEVVKNLRCVSVDGDADRIVYYFFDEFNKFHLLDGDRIATLVARYLMELVRDAGLDLKFGLVQTAYANGNSTKYTAETLKIPVACVQTGVKHLHHKALEFDIGVYFEANGHGTVLFSDNAKNAIASAAGEGKSESAIKLKNIMKIINYTIGDAISDMLLVETILHAKGWSIDDWLKEYNDLCSRLMKVLVQDRNAIKVTDADRKCTAPEGLQKAIDDLVSAVPSGRAFVRPSGTEDVVRVYAEALTQSEADYLVQNVCLAIQKYLPLDNHKPSGTEDLVRVYAEAETQEAADQLALEVAHAVHSIAGGLGEPPSL